MTIFYSPYPSAQPSPTDTRFKVGDVYISGSKVAGPAQKNILGLTFPTYAASSPTYPITIPPIVASASTSSYTANAGQAFNFSAVKAYGGTAVCVPGVTISTYNYSVSPALPAGVTITPTSTTATTTIVGADSITRAYNYIELKVAGTVSTGLSPTTYTVTLTDGAGQTANVSFVLVVSGTLQQLSATTAVANTVLTQNTTATAFIPVTAAGGVAPLTYSINPSLPAGLSFSPASGQISGTATVANGLTTYTVTVTDNLSRTASASFNLTVNPNPVVAVLASATLIGTQNVLFTTASPVLAQVGTGTAPYTYSITPALPSGLTLNTSTGAISGTATIASPSANYTITITDSNQQTANKTFILTINPLPALNTTLTTSSIALIRNVSITPVTPVVASGGYGTYSYSITPSLPGGLSLSTSTGAISGTSSGASTSTSYTITATDQANQTSSKSFSLSVSSANLVASQVTASKTLIKNVPYTAFSPVTATGGFGSFTYSINPSLPAGVAFSSTTGLISGTAVAVSSTASYSISITDQTPQTTSSNFSLNVVLPAAVTATTVVSSTTITQYQSFTPFTPVTAIGGYPTVNGITYTVTPALPSGLSFNQGTGLVSGTPTAYSATATYTVTATDTLSQTSSTQFSLYIKTPTLVATTSVPLQTLVRTAPTAPFVPVTGSGGTAVYSYSVSPSLPSGLVLSTSTGAVSGTPTVTSSTGTYTVTITDSLSQTSTATFSIYVRNPQPLVTTQTVTSTSLIVLVDSANITPVTASGGENGITFAISPTLPDGLTFSTNNGKITGIAHALSSATNYTVFATDGLGQTSNKSFSLSVITQPLVSTLAVSSISLAQYAPMTPQTPVTVTGGTSPYAYSVSPSLPSGLTLNTSTGQISGTPVVSLNTTSFSINIADSASANTSKTVSLYVAPAATLSATTQVNTVTSTINQSLSSVKPVVATGGYASTYTYSINPGLPSGLTFNTTTGYISGTPTVLSPVSQYTVTITDYASATTSSSFNLVSKSTLLTNTVNNQSLIYTLYSLINATTPVVANGGYGSLTYSISPSLPAGISINPTTGQLSGTPTAIQTATVYSVTIADSTSQVTTGTFSLTVNDVVHAQLYANVNNTAVTLSTGVTANFTPITGSGGEGTYTYSITGTNVLPPNLSFDSGTGTISGVPAATFATSTFFVSVTDQVPQTVQKSFTLNVASVPIVNPTSFQTITVTGGAESLSTTTGAVIVAGGAGIGGNINVGGTVNIANTSYINGAEILTTATASKYEVTSVSAGTDTVVNTSTGAVTVWTTSTLQSVTGRGATTDQPITISNLTTSTSTTTGALTVAGGVGVSGNLNVGGTATFLQPIVTIAQPSIYDQTAITVDTTPVTLDSFDSRLYRSAEYTVSVSNTSTSEYQTTRITLIHNGVTPAIEVSSVFTGQQPLVEFSATITNNMVILQGTGAHLANKIKVKPAYITIQV